MSKTITDKDMQAKPQAKDTWLQEPFERGAGVFVARLTPSGERLFYFRYTDSAGKRPYFKIGAYHQKGGEKGWTVSDARLEARTLSEKYLSGVCDLHKDREEGKAAENEKMLLEKERTQRDRAQLEAQAKDAAAEQERKLTVRALFKRWRDTDLQPHLRADGRRMGRIDGGQYTEDQFDRRVFPEIGDMPVDSVGKREIMEILDKAKSEGKLRTANVLYADLKQMFTFAQMRELVQSNPLALLTKRVVGGAPVERDRVLSRDEIIELAKAIPHANMGLRSQFAIWIILATGVRIGELMGATWSTKEANAQSLAEIAEHAGAKIGIVDLAARTWHLPTTKNQRDHTIHLSDFALQQFESLFAMRGLGRWVFPNTAGTGPVSVKSFGKQIADRQRMTRKQLSNRSTQTDALTLIGGRWTAHDLRRTTATLMASLGVGVDVIEECLNHIIASKVARVYIRDRRIEQQAKAFDMVGNLLGTLHANATKG